MKISVISLRGSCDRRHNIDAQLGPLGIAYGFFDAVEVEQSFEFFTTYDERQYLVNTGRGANPGEVACYASHLSLWRRCVASSEPVVIMEDDAWLEANFPAALAFVARRIGHYGFMRLQSDAGRKTSTVIVERGQGFAVHYYRRSHFGAMCYALTPEVAARFIASSRRLAGPVDLFIKKFWLHGQPLFGLTPSVVDASALAQYSTIGERTKEKPGLALRLARTRRKLEDTVARARFNHSTRVRPRLR